MNGLAAPAALWQEARAADGRVYYYNTQTKATQWSKPADMLSAADKTSSQAASWKEYSSNGRKYWHNTETNQTTWDMPDALKNAQPPVQAQPPKPAAAPTFVAGGVSSYQESYQPRERERERDRDRDRDDYGYSNRHDSERSSGYGQMAGVRSSAMASHTDHDYSSLEEAEAVFHKLLRRAGVQADWTWDQTVQATVKDPQYRSIKDPKDRRIAFDKYVAEVRAQEKDKEKDRQAKVRSDFYQMLRSHSEIKHSTRWKTARSIVEGETMFRAARNEDEAHAIFNDYRAELLKSFNEDESNRRKTALDRLVLLLQSVDLEPYTRWNEAYKILKADERFQGDETFKSLSKIDTLKAFENHIKALERTFNDHRQKQKALKARQDRQTRDQYAELLKDLRAGGKLKAGTKWCEIHHLIGDDPRYVAMLGLSGSTPLDLFWDMVEEEDRALRNKRNDALDVLEEKRYELTHKTTYDEFLSVMQTDRRTAIIEPDSMRQIFERLREKVLRRSDEDRHNQRRAVDALRSKMKHLEPPVTSSDTWEQVRPRLEKLDEYRALESDDLRRQAFDKLVRRLKERDEERDRDRSRRRERDHDKGRDRERERERDHEHRSSRGDHHRPRHRTRSPEADAYEADRKRAQADRERQHRRGSFGISPPHRRSEREERHERGGDFYDGRSRTGATSHYDRERRERETERERTYMTRADPRDAGSALDYGESKPTAVRKRRESDAAEGRETKRLRGSNSSREPTYSHSPRSHRRSKSPGQQAAAAAAAAAAKEAEVGYKSGSEEGEIEEE